MFYILHQKEEAQNDLKIIINFKKSKDDPDNIEEFQTSLKNVSLISDLISHNIKEKDSKSTYKQDITITESFDKDLFISLAKSIFNNEKVLYSETNCQILLKISEEFKIEKLNKSIKRYISYLDEFQQFSVGRNPIIDEELLCQFYLLDLNEENVEDTHKASCRFIEKLTSETYGQILYRCIYSRLSKSKFYLNFIVNELNDFTPKFIQTLMKNYRFFSFTSVIGDYDIQVVSYLLRYFLENNYLKRADEESFNYQCGWRSYTYQFFDFDDGNIHYDSTYYVYRHYDELEKDNYALHRKLVLEGKNQNNLFQIIEKDDLESLKKLIAFDPSIDIDTMIESCYYESRPLFQNDSYSLIEIAAYFCSINIFKYLIANNATIRKKELAITAMYGGNSEIIRICEQNDICFSCKIDDEYDVNSSIMIAIKMHHIDLLRWLIDKEDEDSDDIKRYFDLFISFALRCSNYAAFYYLNKFFYGVIYGVFYDEEKLYDHQTDFKKYVNALILSYNIPIIENCLNLKNENLQSKDIELENKYFLDILFINNDTKLIDLFLKDNRIEYLKAIPYENISSLTYQKMGRFLLSHQNVTYLSDVFLELVQDLLNDELVNKEDDFKVVGINNVPVYNQIKSPEFITQQIQFLFEKSLSSENKILMLPIIFKYNLYENHYADKYADIFSAKDIGYFGDIENHRDIFKGFIKYINPEILEFVLKKMRREAFNKFGESKYFLSDSLENNKIDIFKFLITSENSPYSKKFKFNKESFFEIFYKIKSTEVLKEVVQIFNENCKDCNFYEDIFLPEVLYYSYDSNYEIIEYLLNIPEIEPYINKFNEEYSNLPPLFNICKYYISEDCYKPFLDNEKVDINIRDNENRNILSYIQFTEIAIFFITNERFKFTPEDATLCMENSRYPGNIKLFETFLNGLLYENDPDHKNQLNFKIEFNDEQLSRIFSKICITDNRVELAKLFYSKFSDRIDVNYTKDDDFCLLNAIDCDSSKMVEFLLSISELDLNRRGSTGSVNSHMDYINDITPFCFAVVCGKDEIIHLFFKRKSDFDINETFSAKIFSIFLNQITCLHYAAMNNNAILIKKLLNFPGIDKSIQDAIFFFF